MTKMAAATSAPAASISRAIRTKGWVNYGTYRVMIHDKNKVGFYISPGKHGRIQREKYAASGKPFKIAMSFGHDPLTFLGRQHRSALRRSGV